MAGKKNKVAELPKVGDVKQEKSPLAKKCDDAQIEFNNAKVEYHKIRKNYFEGKALEKEFDEAIKKVDMAHEEWKSCIRKLAKEKIKPAEQPKPKAAAPTAKQEKTVRPNPFAGADDIYVTKNKIAVTKTKKAKAARGFKKTTQTKYYARNRRNVKQLKAAQGDTVRDGRKGTKYTRL